MLNAHGHAQLVEQQHFESLRSFHFHTRNIIKGLHPKESKKCLQVWAKV